MALLGFSHAAAGQDKFVKANLMGPSLGTASPRQTATGDDLELHFAKMQKLSFKILKSGSSGSDLRDMRDLRDFFVSAGDVGARFLVQKLEKENSDEMAFMKSQGWDESKTDLTVQWIDKRTGPPKYDLCFILADMFERVSPDAQAEILSALRNSYTPSTFFSEDIQFLNHALARVGRSAIPVWLNLANQETEFVRCSISSLLRDLAERLSGREGGKDAVPSAPVIPCTGPVEQRRKASAAWQEWWESYGKFRRFPEIESIYDRM